MPRWPDAPFQTGTDYSAARLAWIMLNDAHGDKYANDSLAELWAALDDAERAKYLALWRTQRKSTTSNGETKGAAVSRGTR